MTFLFFPCRVKQSVICVFCGLLKLTSLNFFTVIIESKRREKKPNRINRWNDEENSTSVLTHGSHKCSINIGDELCFKTFVFIMAVCYHPRHLYDYSHCILNSCSTRVPSMCALPWEEKKIIVWDQLSVHLYFVLRFFFHFFSCWFVSTVEKETEKRKKRMDRSGLYYTRILLSIWECSC